MRSGIIIELTSADRDRLERISKDRNTPQKHVWRAEIVLLSANGVGTSEIMRRTGTSKTDGGQNSRGTASRIEVAERKTKLKLARKEGQ